MSLDVDKTWRHGEAVGIDDLVRVISQGQAERSDAAARESYITDSAWATAAVDYDTTTDQDIPGHSDLRNAEPLVLAAALGKLFSVYRERARSQCRGGSRITPEQRS
jgi:hypothetical protein